VTFLATAEYGADMIYVPANTPIVFADWTIMNPSIGGFVTTDSSRRWLF
jgi:hypothetical protein